MFYRKNSGTKNNHWNYLRGRVTGREEESITRKMVTWPQVGQTEARSLGLHPCLPYDVQFQVLGPSPFTPGTLPGSWIRREAIENQSSTLTWDVGTASRSLNPLHHNKRPQTLSFNETDFETINT